jgi:serine/threonine-protein phosphatase 6 regulatory ankyrin repeat subunit B
MDLINAVENNNIDIVKLLLEKKDIHKININLQNKDGWTALIFASYHGNIDIVKLLCNFDRRSKFTEQSGFQPDCSLLEKEDILNINLQTNKKETALIIASIYDYKDIVNLLLQKDDININLQNNTGWTALMYASSNGKIDIVKLLLQKDDININLKNDHRVTALIFASFFGNIDTVKLLDNYNSLLSLTNLI